jgi:protoporphyrinogen oxidase
VERLWEEVLGDDFMTRPRLSRIYYRGRFFAYPLVAGDVLRRLGLLESALCASSYLRHRFSPRREQHSFEDWVARRFGPRLYETFFRSYTEKVWGIPGSEIRAEWAAQRIRNFSFGKAVSHMLGVRRAHVTTLIEEFRYPRLGPGQMWEAFRRRVEEKGIPVHLCRPCVAVRHRDHRVHSVVVGTNGSREELPVDGVLSSIPLSELVLGLDPLPAPEFVAAANRLRYRDLCVVALLIDEPQPFPDNWIYLHDPGTRAARVQNFGAWSEDMVVPGTTCLGVEYFCFEGDDLWELPDEQSITLAKEELGHIGLIDPTRVVDGVKVRVPKAYPMYDSAYKEAVALLRGYLASFDNLHTFGRNGLHRYNNQDHSMWTGMLAALNVTEGSRHDVWAVNTEDEYLEEGELVDGFVGAEEELTPSLH